MAFDHLNRMTTSQGFNYVHDTVGNRLSKRIGSQVRNGYTWDSSNRLRTYSDVNTIIAPGQVMVGMGGANYTYLPNGLRCTKVWDATTALIEDPSEGPVLSSFYDSNTALNDTTTRYRYDGQMTLEEDVTFTQGENTYVDQTSYLLGGRGIEMITARRMDGPTPAGLDLPRSSFPIYDGHGNMIATLAKSGTSFTLANEKKYDVWGAVRSSSGAGSHVVDPNKQFSAKLGHTWDGESGLINMRARYYEPSTGRFINQDPLMYGLNWYSYAGNNPILYVDRTGLYFERFYEGFKFLFHGNDHQPSHLHIYDGKQELFSRRLDGNAWHGTGFSLPKRVVDALVRGIKSGDRLARNIANRIVAGGFGISDEILDILRGALGGISIIAYTSIEAYAQINPEDFAAIFRNIAGDVSA